MYCRAYPERRICFDSALLARFPSIALGLVSLARSFLALASAPEVQKMSDEAWESGVLEAEIMQSPKFIDWSTDKERTEAKEGEE